MSVGFGFGVPDVLAVMRASANLDDLALAFVLGQDTRFFLAIDDATFVGGFARGESFELVGWQILVFYRAVVLSARYHDYQPETHQSFRSHIFALQDKVPGTLYQESGGCTRGK